MKTIKIIFAIGVLAMFAGMILAGFAKMAGVDIPW